jgi:transposase-like protein
MDSRLNDLIELVQKMPADRIEEAINNLKRIQSDVMPPCPHCNCPVVVRAGFTRERKQRYRCEDCGKTYIDRVNIYRHYFKRVQ